MARGHAAAVWLIVGTILTVAVAGIVLIPEHEEMPTWARVVFTVMAASLGIVGALVVTRQPRNAVGWILWGAALAVTVSTVAAAYGSVLVTSGEPVANSTAVVVWASQVGFTPAITAIMIFVPLLFPDGRYLSPRWRWAGALWAAVVLTIFARNAFLPGPFADNVTIDNPLGIPALAAIRPVIEVINGPGAIAAAMLAVASSVLRYRRGSAIERAQLRWFGAAIGLVLMSAMLLVVYVVYVVVVVVVVTLQGVLAPLTNENTVAVAASTLVAAALFQPMRHRVQRAVDRRCDRARYGGRRTVDAFAERLRSQVDLDSLGGEIARVARDTVRPASTTIWIRTVRRDPSSAIS